MSSHTINSWKKYCLYRGDAVEDLRKRAISNTEKKAISKDNDATNMTGIETIEGTLPTPREPTPQQANPDQNISQQTDSQHTVPLLDTLQQSTPQSTIPQQPALQFTIPQQVTPPPTTPRQVTPQPTIPQQATTQLAIPQQVTPQQATPADESQPPPPYEKVARPEPVVVKTEPLDEDHLDFAFATEVLSGWKPNEESDAALWKRMETMACSLVFSRVFGVADERS
jgi:hypothetical protein